MNWHAQTFRMVMYHKSMMINFDSYLKGILKQIVDSYRLLNNLQDKPGDLEIIKKETAKIKGLLQVVINKLETTDNNSDAYVELFSAANYYIENFEFLREIETMSKLYSEDLHRLKNLRQTIIESLQDRKLIEKIESIMAKL